MIPERIRENLENVLARIADAAKRAGRAPADVTLVAVTKRSPAEWILPLIECGARQLGENYPQELWRKADELTAQSPDWHLIGHLQGNKAKKTVPLVKMIHSVDSLKLLQQLDELASGSDPSTFPRVCLQVNTSEEVAKHGWSSEEILRDAAAIAALRHVPVVGLMTMAAFGTTPETARPSFIHLRATRDALREQTGLELPHLSMGMSSDFETAVEEGATLVRVGSALFEGLAP